MYKEFTFCMKTMSEKTIFIWFHDKLCELRKFFVMFAVLVLTITIVVLLSFMFLNTVCLVIIWINLLSVQTCKNWKANLGSRMLSHATFIGLVAKGCRMHAKFFYFCTDARRRNSFKNQPELCKWNLLKLAEAIQDALPLHKSKAALEDL